jgi:hypothetical protein
LYVARSTPPLPAPDEEQRALVRSILAMSDADVDALPPEQRDGVAHGVVDGQQRA